MNAISLPSFDSDPNTLSARLSALAQSERELKVEFLRLLGELDSRRYYLELGYPSSFAFLTGHLGLSNASAFRRITAARLLGRMPSIAGYLESGRLSLTKLSYLKDVLTEESCKALLERAAALGEKE